MSQNGETTSNINTVASKPPKTHFPSFFSISFHHKNPPFPSITSSSSSPSTSSFRSHFSTAKPPPKSPKHKIPKNQRHHWNPRLQKNLLIHFYPPKAVSLAESPSHPSLVVRGPSGKYSTDKPPNLQTPNHHLLHPPCPTKKAKWSKR